jgi:hypothetical protein
LIRLVFAALMLLGLKNEMAWSALPQPDRDPLPLLESRAAGLGLVNVRPVAPDVDFVAAPGCDVPVQLGLYTADGDESPRIAPLLMADVTPLYIFAGGVAGSVAGLHPIRRWLAANVAAMIGRRDERAPSRFVLVLLPKACPGLAGVDWVRLSP